MQLCSFFVLITYQEQWTPHVSDIIYLDAFLSQCTESSRIERIKFYWCDLTSRLIFIYPLVMTLILSCVTYLDMSLCSIEKFMLAVNEPAKCIDILIYFHKRMFRLKNQFWAEFRLKLCYCRLSWDTECGLYYSITSYLIIIRIDWSSYVPYQYSRFILELYYLLTTDDSRLPPHIPLPIY